MRKRRVRGENEDCCGVVQEVREKGRGRGRGTRSCGFRVQGPRCSAMAGSTIIAVLFVFGGLASNTRCNQIHHFDKIDKRFMAMLEDAAIEIDFIGEKHHSSKPAPRILFQIGHSEEELPECSDKSEVCSKVDLYGTPWVERQCRCPGGRACPNSFSANDGYTIVDKTRQYKLCEPVKRLPICRYFKDVTWTLAPGGGPNNATVQRVYCRCRPSSVPYLLKRQPHKSSEGDLGYVFSFACSPQSRLRCQYKEPCRLFTVRKRRNSHVEEVTASPLCQCPKGFRCPRKHTDLGSSPARSYSGALEIETFSGYCVPFLLTNVYTF